MPTLFQNVDDSILFFIQDIIKNPVLDRLMVWISSLGDAGFLWFVIVALLILQSRYKCGIILLISIPLAMLFGDVLLKHLIGRIRPCNVYPEVELIVKRLTTYSFPSGHTMVAFSSAAVLYHHVRRYGICAYIIASLIAFSRMYLFVHYPSDILGGIIFGTANAYIVIYSFKLFTHITGKKIT